MNTSSPLGIVVAKMILSGDVHGARLMAAGRTTWSPAEARAIIGACRDAQAKFAGCRVSFSEFL